MSVEHRVLDEARDRARDGVRRVGSQRVQAIAVLGVLGGLVATVAIRNPHVPGSLGTCPSLLLFGVYCPGCGSLRGLYDLTHGAVLESLGHNILLLPARIFLVGWSILKLRPGAGERAGPMRWVARNPDDPEDPGWTAVWARPRLAKVQLALVIALPFLVILFAVLRNLPGSSLAP